MESTKQKNKLMKKLFLLLIPLLLVGCSLFPTDQTNQNNNINQEAEKKSENLFIAKQNFGENYTINSMDVKIYNPETDEFITEKNIKSPDWITASSYGASYKNMSVQFNEKTGDIYWLTYGSDMMTGGCTNEDGTCFSRIYKTNIDSTEIEKIAEFDIEPTTWVLDDVNNNIYTGYLLADTGEQTINKIDLATNEVSVLLQQEYQEHGTYGKMVFSNDGKSIYQGVVESVDSWTNEILRLNKIDIDTGNIQVEEIYQGESIHFDTDISPNNFYLTFYEGQNSKLYYHNLVLGQTQNILLNDEVGNYNLAWSGDSKKILYLLDSQMGYYNIESITHNKIMDTDGPGFSFIWAPQDKYLVHQENLNQIKIFNTETNTDIDSKLEFFSEEIHPSEIIGMQWINI